MNTFKMNIPEYAAAVRSALTAHGDRAYFVGGCVRDSLLGRAISDYDIAVSAPPATVISLLSGFRVIETGLSHGTVTVVTGAESLEVTSFRRDGKYLDHRRPETVSPTTRLEDDLSRRDFTVNAMAYSPEEGLIDLFGGAVDLSRGIIRCVGDPLRRFDEDALRILRALRFASVLGFDIEEKTDRALREMVPLLSCISGERIFAELCKLLCGQAAGRILLEYQDVICAVIPELAPCVGLDQKNPHHVYDVYAHIAHTVDACPPDAALRLAALFHDICKPQTMTEDEDGIRHFRGHQSLSADTAMTILRRLHAPLHIINPVCALIRLHDVRPELTRKSLRRYISKITAAGADPDALMKLRRADLAAHAPADAWRSQLLDAEEKAVADLHSEQPCFSLRDMQITGDDIIALGISPGARIGELLRALFDAVLDERVENEHEALISLAKSMLSDTK